MPDHRRLPEAAPPPARLYRFPKRVAYAAGTLAARAVNLPLVFYPNSGETWDGTARAWRGRARIDEASTAGWLAAGARLVGGCCRVTPAHIRALVAAIRS